MVNCPQNWIKNNRGGYSPGPNHPYQMIKKLLKENGFKEQTCGEIYTNGEFETNFYNGSEVIHISYTNLGDEEELEAMKQEMVQ